MRSYPLSRSVQALFLFCILLSGAWVQAFSGSGAGTQANPYLITNVDQLQEMAASLSAFYALANDIDASATSDWNDNGTTTYTIEGFAPVGIDNDTPFTGSLNGRGYAIQNLFVDRGSTDFNRSTKDYVGLFGSVSNPNSGIYDVTLEDADISGRHYVGALAGYVDSGSITSCTVLGGSVLGTGYVGGLIGYTSDSPVSQCYATDSVSGTWEYVGGLIGYNAFDSAVSQSYATGSVSGGRGGDSVGGLIGYNASDSAVSESDATGSVSGN